VVHIFDMHGFGYSGGIRQNGRMRYFVEDLHLVMLENFNDLPCFLYGHSLGAAVILDYLTLNDIQVAGVVMTSPMLAVPEYWKFSAAHHALLETFGTLWDVARPHQEVVMNTNINPTTSAKDNFVCTRINHFLRNSTHVGIGMIRDITKSIASNPEKLKKFKYPLLIVHGKKNASVPHEEIVKAMKVFGSNDKTLKLIEGGFIELYCDIEKEALAVVITDWILKQAKKGLVLGNLKNYKLKIEARRVGILSFKNVLLLLSYLLTLK
jgi:alpha-beta hydrolase superfamily lysophospholipase